MQKMALSELAVQVAGKRGINAEQIPVLVVRDRMLERYKTTIDPAACLAEAAGQPTNFDRAFRIAVHVAG